MIRRTALAVLLTALMLSAVTVVTVGTSARHATPAGAQSLSTPAYWLAASDGGVFTFGGAPFYGSAGDIPLNAPVVGMASTPGGGGYWLVAADGGVFTYGNARFWGSTGDLRLNAPIVAMASTPDGGGYWLVAADGGVFSFGDATFYGSVPGILQPGQGLNRPVVGMGATGDGHGYWIVAADGGIFTFGDAGFWGSTGSLVLNKPVVGMIAATNGAGYFLVAADGGIFSFGSMPFWGSLGGVPLNDPIVAATATPTDNGYWFTSDTGVVSPFGSAGYYGSAPAPLNAPIVGMAVAPGDGVFAGPGYAPGSYGYDVSVYQCGNLPPPEQIGIVQVTGASSGAPNPCLAQEAAWAGTGLNLYVFLTYATSPVNEPGCGGNQACNAGYQAGIFAFDVAEGDGVNGLVPWWLDVEPDGTWSGDPGSNDALIQGALNALHLTEGVSNVGIYASPGLWNSIVGAWQPDVPFWMADWLNTPSGPGSCADYSRWVGEGYLLPTGPLEVVQYASEQDDLDYAC